MIQKIQNDASHFTGTSNLMKVLFCHRGKKVLKTSCFIIWLFIFATIAAIYAQIKALMILIKSVIFFKKEPQSFPL